MEKPRMNSEKQIFPLKKSEIWILVGIFTVIAFFFTIYLFFLFSYWGILDWDQHLFYHAVPRKTLLEHHQFPLWNPYYCGGTVMLANPQSRFLSPTFLLILLLGEVKGIKLEIWLHLVIGMMGMYLLGRHYGLDKLSAWMPSFVYMLSSMYPLNLSVGMTWFLSVAYLPWAFLCYLKGFESLNFSLLSGLFLVLMYFSGGAYPLAITLLFLAFYSLTVVRKHGVVRVVRNLSSTLIFAFLLGAVKLLPSIAFLHEHPRRINDYSGFSLNLLLHSLLSRDQSISAMKRFEQKEGFLDGMSYGMDENGMYIGLIPLLLFLLGLFLHRRHWRLLLCFLLFLWLSFGDRVPLSLWKLAHAMPIYDSMRVAQRFRIVFMLIMAIFSGFGLLSLRSYVLRRFTRPIMADLTGFVILGVILVDLMLVNSPIFKEAFPILPLETKREENFYQISRFSDYGSGSGMYPAFLSNIGVVEGYESANVPRNAIPKGSPSYKGEVFLHGTEGKVFIRSWSPNKVLVEVDISKEGYLVLNQNFYTGWRAKAEQKRKVVSLEGLIGVKVLPQDKVIELRYLPVSFIFGLILSCITALSCVISPSK